MTSPDTTEPTARAEPPQAQRPAAPGAAGTGNRLAWLDVLRGLAALCVVFNHFGYFVPSRLNGPVYQWINPLPGPHARPGTRPGSRLPHRRIVRATASWCCDSTVVAQAARARAARGAAAAAA